MAVDVRYDCSDVIWTYGFSISRLRCIVATTNSYLRRSSVHSWLQSQVCG